MESTIHVPHSALVRAKLLRVTGAPHDEVEAALASALEIAREKAPFYEPLIHLEHAEFAADQDDGASRRVALEAARDLLAETGVTARAEEITKQLG